MIYPQNQILDIATLVFLIIIIIVILVLTIQNFINYLKEQNKVVRDLQEMTIKLKNDSHSHAVELADRFIERQETTQKSFQDHIQKITESQNKILTEAILAISKLEKSLDNVRDNVQLLLVKIKSTEIEARIVETKSIENRIINE